MLRNCYRVANTRDGLVVTDFRNVSVSIPRDLIFEFYDEEADESEQLKTCNQLSAIEAVEVAKRLSSTQ